ncbi:toll-like receptor 7 isoform X1 [Clavelina lepadiformis]|uniref:toll-like receptor 7 isoform X1 n=1 Tax=Clavelina lepadiformis TaxID=159417 RepID=UPI0040434E6D
MKALIPKLWLQCLLFSVGFFRNPLNPCEPVSSINGVDFLAWTEKLVNPTIRVERFAPWLDRDYIYVDCYGRGLKAIPQNIAGNVEALDLSYNGISHIKSIDFEEYRKLKLLNILGNCNMLTGQCPNCLYIEPGALDHLIQLKWLTLEYNYLCEFPRKLPSSIFGLDITRTWLGEITTHLDHLSNLTIFISQLNCFGALASYECPRNFTINNKLPSTLKFLDLKDNSWKRIPTTLLRSELKGLILTGNKVFRLKKDDFTNATGLEILDLSKMLSTESISLSIDEGAFDPLTHLQFLNLSWNFIPFLSDKTFQQNKDLIALDVSFNCLKKTIFEPTYLENLVNLHHLDLSFNNSPGCGRPETIDLLRLGDLYSKFTLLQSLILGTTEKAVTSSDWSMQFRIIDNQSFASLSKLSHFSTIDISYCNVHHFSTDAWSRLRHLKSLRATHNFLSFENIYSNQSKILSKVKTVESFSTGFESKKRPTLKLSLPGADFECNQTGAFDYSNNQIATVRGKQNFLLPSATILDLSHNNIKELQMDDVKHLKYLCSINLSHNPIFKVDKFAFSELSNLHQILLTGETMTLYDYTFLCHLSAASDVDLTWQEETAEVNAALSDWQEIENCTVESVVSLTISKNDLRYIEQKPNFLEFFPNTRQLVVRDCSLKGEFSSDWLQGLNHLESLDMSYNNILHFPSSTLEGIKSLRLLKLDHNDIVQLKGNISSLNHLEILTAARNKITFIQPEFFSNLHLQKLDLSYNYLSRLDPSIFNKNMLDSLLYLDVRWNELDCYCFVWDNFYLWYISDVSDKTQLPGFYSECTTEIDEYYGGCVACHTPLGLRGRPVSRYGYNTSCDLQINFLFTVVFTVLIATFILCGIVGYSKWFKRFIFRKVNEYFRVHSLKSGNILLTPQADKDQNVFVFFDCSNDALGDWVDNKLVPGMINGEPSIKVFLSGRDIEVGSAPTENLLRLVSMSRKTILILSGHFCDTPICRFLLIALQELQHSAGRDQLILMEWHGEEAARVPELIQQSFNRKFYNFLKFDYTNDDEVMFFEVLRTAFCKSTKL